MIFLDANVFIHAAGAGSPFREPCRRILTAAVRSGLETATSSEVVQEIPYRYHRASRLIMGVERAREARAIVTALLQDDEDDLRRAVSMLERHEQVGLRDAIHAASALRYRCERIVSTDRGFDALAAEGVIRADPIVFSERLPGPRPSDPAAPV